MITAATPLEAALAYAACGWAVFPLMPGGKTPATAHGFKDATTDAATITALWAEMPAANIGVATGTASQLTVLDVDRKPDKDGYATLRGLGFELPSTPMQVTQSGGAQLMFDYAPGVKNTAGKLGVGLDTRGDGGYIVVPPSRVDGRAYTWLVAPFDGTPFAPMPAALLERLGASDGSKARRPACEWAAVLHGVPEGRRQEELVRVVGKLIAEVRDREFALTLAHEWAQRCEPPLPAAEVDRCFANIERKEDTKATTGDGQAQGLKLVRLSEVPMLPVPWLWPGYLAHGAIHLIVGDPDNGKTLMALDLAARITTGAAFPDGVPNHTAPSDVIVLSAEDANDYTIRPRIEAAGGDSSRVHVLSADAAEEGLSLKSDIARLEGALVVTGARLVVIDPVSAYLPGVDTYRDNEVRSTLAPFRALAERRSITVIGIVHMSKNTERTALQRVLGSTAFTALSRATFMVSRDPDADDDEQRRLFLPVKFNLGKKPAGLAFRTVGADVQTPEGRTIKSVRAEWDTAPVAAQADEVLRHLAKGPSSAREVAAALQEALKDGPVLAKDVMARLEKPEPTLRRARERLRVESMRDPADPMHGPYYWLPPRWPAPDREGWVRRRMAQRRWSAAEAVEEAGQPAAVVACSSLVVMDPEK